MLNSELIITKPSPFVHSDIVSPLRIALFCARMNARLRTEGGCVCDLKTPWWFVAP